MDERTKSLAARLEIPGNNEKSIVTGERILRVGTLFIPLRRAIKKMEVSSSDLFLREYIGCAKLAARHN